MIKSEANGCGDSLPERCARFYNAISLRVLNPRPEIRPGVREVGYDNERGEGDHRHYQGAETKYVFRSVEQLMADFWSDVRTLRGST